MPMAKTALLPDRSVIAVTGPDAEKLLQGVITNDMALLADQPAIFAGLLTPQGKILAEFFVAKAGDGFLLDIATAQAGELVKRLALYKLRAKVDIRDATAEHAVLAVWGSETQGMVSFPDPRLPALGLRVLAETGTTNGTNAALTDYDVHRIQLGVPEGGKDYAIPDTFPHEANFDLLNGVSFTKGCFIGQEVVSRMQHRGTARKRIVIIDGEGPLTSAAQITAGPATIGAIGSVAGSQGLALIRLDRAEEAKTKGVGLAAGETRITVRMPGYMKLPAGAAAP